MGYKLQNPTYMMMTEILARLGEGDPIYRVNEEDNKRILKLMVVTGEVCWCEVGGRSDWYPHGDINNLTLHEWADSIVEEPKYVKIDNILWYMGTRTDVHIFKGSCKVPYRRLEREGCLEMKNPYNGKWMSTGLTVTDLIRDVWYKKEVD